MKKLIRTQLHKIEIKQLRIVSLLFLLTFSLNFQAFGKTKASKSSAKSAVSLSDEALNKEKAALEGNNQVELSPQAPVMSINEDESAPLGEVQSGTEGLEVKSEEAKKLLTAFPKNNTLSESPAVEAAVDESAKSLEPENETPVFKNAKVAASLNAPAKSDSSPMPKLLATLGILLIVLFCAWTFLKRYSKRSQKSTDPLKVKVISQHFLSPKRSLVVVQIAGETILLGATDHNINVLKSLSLLDEEIPDHVPQNFDTTLHQHRRDVDEGELDSELSREARNSFALSGLSDVRDRVSRKLSDMRNL